MGLIACRSIANVNSNRKAGTAVRCESGGGEWTSQDRSTADNVWFFHKGTCSNRTVCACDTTRLRMLLVLFSLLNNIRIYAIVVQDKSAPR